jgi:ATP-dependent helicase HrpA
VLRLAEWALERDLAWAAKEMRALGKKQPNKPAGGFQSFGDALGGLASLSIRPPESKPAAMPPPIARGKSATPARDTAPPADAETLFAESACRHLARHLFRLEPPLPLSASRFEAMLTTARRELPSLARQVGERAREIIALRDAIAASPKRYDGLEDDLRRLVPPDFLAHTPHDQLGHLLRYLRAVQIRAERASVSPLARTKDLEKARQLAPFLPDGECRVPAHHRETFRWLLEEFRVSIFAQELGTAQPVSAQRLWALAE